MNTNIKKVETTTEPTPPQYPFLRSQAPELTDEEFNIIRMWTCGWVFGANEYPAEG